MILKNLVVPCVLLTLCLSVFSCIKDHVIPPDNTQTERLLFRAWEMVAEENGIDSLKYVKRSFVTFSSNGTWSSSTGSYAPIGSGDDRYWKWHPTVPNRLLWWYPGHPTNESNYIDLRVVTEDSLKITHSNVYFKGKYNFVPHK